VESRGWAVRNSRLIHRVKKAFVIWATEFNAQLYKFINTQLTRKSDDFRTLCSAKCRLLHPEKVEREDDLGVDQTALGV
jgi:hypothetical protein